MAKDFADPEQKQLSGRRVKHSRNGCISCKARRVRCPEERPCCSRCMDEGRSCEYTLNLTWRDDSLRRGIKHGRGRNDEIYFVDPIPYGLEKGRKLENRRVYFLNTKWRDMDDQYVQPMAQSLPRGDTRMKLRSGPQLLDLSNVDGVLFQYYQVNVCKSLMLVDDSSNCFRQIIMPLSMSHESVKNSLLAIGALYMSLEQLNSSIDYYGLALRHRQRTLQHLRFDIQSFNGSSSNHILVSMLLLCLFDITDNCQSSWATHVSAAAKLVGGSAQPVDASLLSFVTSFFATRDVMGRSACGKRSKFQESIGKNAQEVDKASGCSPELLHIISTITDISRQATSNPATKDPELAQRIANLEVKLENLIQILPSSLAPSEASFLSQSSILTHNAAKIYLCTALHSKSPSTLRMQSMLTEQIQFIREISTLRPPHLWSIFVSAFYASEDEQRMFFLEQFEKLESWPATRASAQNAKAILTTAWKKRDLEADVKVARNGVNDWVRFVRPLSEGLNLA